MKRSKLLTSMSVAVLLSFGSAPAFAQVSVRDLALSTLQEGKAYYDSGKYADAASSFESVFLGMDDPNKEFPDLRADTGVFLCLSRARNDQLDAARSACNSVIQMRDAPQSVKDQAAKLLGKLN